MRTSRPKYTNGKTRTKRQEIGDCPSFLLVACRPSCYMTG